MTSSHPLPVLFTLPPAAYRAAVRLLPAAPLVKSWLPTAGNSEQFQV